MKYKESKIKFIEKTKETYLWAAKEYAKKAKRNKDLLERVLVEMENRGIEFWSRVPVGPRMDVRSIMNSIGKELLERDAENEN